LVCDFPHFTIGRAGSILAAWRLAMFETTQSIHPVQSIFGSGYVAEQHADQTNFVDDREARFAEFVQSLRSLVWNDDRAAKQ
jgi:hypothetical protein